MRIKTAAFLVMSLLLPTLALAGGQPSTPINPAPTLGDAGLIALGLTLAGTGIALLRRKR